MVKLLEIMVIQQASSLEESKDVQSLHFFELERCCLVFA